MKQKTAIIVNFIFWVVFTAFIMICVYFAWSKHGNYNADSFFASLVIHGGPCALFGAVCKDAILRHYRNRR